MKVSFKNKKSETFYQSEEALVVAHGKRIAQRVVQRILELEAAENPQQLPKNARFHEHIGRRKGLFSVDLIHPFRLIVWPTCEYVSWVEITSIEIYEIVDPH